MKTSMIGQEKKKDDSGQLSSIASMLTSYVASAFQAKLAHYQNATVDADSPFHGLAMEKFLQPLGGLAAKMPLNLANAQTYLSADHALNSVTRSTAAPTDVENEHTESLASLQLKSGDVASASDSTPAAANGLPFQDLVQEASHKYNVPVALVNAIIRQESAFKSDATSHCGAMGLMQLMPATAKAYGCNDGYDARQNVMAGTRFLGDLLKRYQGDVTLATAAYNAGPGNVAKYGGQVPPFKETQDYVAKVTGYYKDNLATAQNALDRFAKLVQPDDKKFQKTLG
jgi:soluble lytic murein transglycosylase-like protein